jgi:hypothetical protein
VSVALACAAVILSVIFYSGAAAVKTNPRALLFVLDGVSAEQVAAAAARRRIPSVDFFGRQGAECRLDYSTTSCACADPSATAPGSIATLTSGAAPQSHLYAVSPIVGPADVSLTGTTAAFASSVVTTVMRAAKQASLNVAALGGWPLMGDGSAQRPCGLMDDECANAGGATGQCMVPSATPAAVTTCNADVVAAISPADQPADVATRVQEVIELGPDLVVVHIPRAVFTNLTGAPQPWRTDVAGDSTWGIDTALYRANAVFGTVARAVATRAYERDEAWLIVLATTPSGAGSAHVALNVVGATKNVAAAIPTSGVTLMRVAPTIASWIGAPLAATDDVAFPL